MNIEKLKKLVEQYHKSKDYYFNTQNAYNEQACRDEYINPLLECFGWDVQNKKGTLPQYKEVVVEKFSNSNERPDYTLTLNGVSKLFVEAKKPSVNICEDNNPAKQIRQYGWNAKHKIGILTNFQDLIVYDTTHKPLEVDTVNTAIFRKYHYLEYVEKFNEINDLISRENVYSGKFDDLMSENFQDIDRYHTQVDDTFLDLINTWRLELGTYLYQSDDKYKDIDVLNDIVQAFINQLIFLRICEDRNLPLYLKLKDVASNKKELKKSLNKLIRKADSRYNSGLFNAENPIFDLSNEIIYGMIKALYYPESPFLFSIIEPSLLGKIYEAFLTESLIISNNTIQLAEKREYKYKSVVSTPAEIVKYMVKNTLENVCANKNPDEILQLRIGDIACGSGIFLEEAYQYLVEYCTEWYAKNKPEYLIELSNGMKKIPLSLKKKLLVNCIFGVDIDIHAVEVCKFSLLLKLIENETEPSVTDVTPILPDLSNNISHGNSLVSNVDLNRYQCTTKDLVDIVPYDWNEKKKFDVIIGNPPYVKTEDIHALSNEIEFKVYKSKFKSAYKQFDKYFLFIEQALKLIGDHGEICFIIPNKFYKIAAGQELRKLLYKKVKRIADFGDLQIFPDKTIYSCIMTAQNQVVDKLNYAYINSLTSIWSDNEVEKVTLKNDIFTDSPWRLTTDIKFLKMLNTLEVNSCRLEDVVDIYNGIQTSAERAERFSDKKEVYWFSNSNILEEDSRLIKVNKYGKEYSIEKSILKPYFKPTKKAEKGMTTYTILNTDKRIIFPYDEDGKLIDIDTLKKVYPGVYEYLVDCYDRLVPKNLNNGVGRDIPNATEDTWYQYGRTQALTAFINKPKLIVRVLSKEPMYALDKVDMLISSGGTAGYVAVSTREDSEYSLEYVQAWLAHPYTEKIFQIMGSDFENGFTARGTYLLNIIPFAKLNLDDHRQREIYDLVVNTTKKIYAISAEMENKKDKKTKSVLEKEKNMLVNLIEETITKVYQQDFR